MKVGVRHSYDERYWWADFAQSGKDSNYGDVVASGMVNQGLRLRSVGCSMDATLARETARRLAKYHPDSIVVILPDWAVTQVKRDNTLYWVLQEAAS